VNYCCRYVEWIERYAPQAQKAQHDKLSTVLGETWLVWTPYTGKTPLWVFHGIEQLQERLRWGHVPRQHLWTLREVQDLVGPGDSPITTLEEAAHLLASECPQEARLLSPHMTGEGEGRKAVP
jgi:hypothetical protein